MKAPVTLALVFCALLSPALAGVDQTVTELLPKLAAAKVEDRYGPQMELQAMAANASRPGAETERAELAKILAAKAADPSVPQPARVWIVRQLEYIGAAESVATLTALLYGTDAELQECARRALEKNSSPAAVESLRTALAKATDAKLSIGLVQSLGERADTAAVALIASRLPQPETAFAAAAALGKIADDRAVTELWRAFDQKIAPASEGLIAAANRMAAHANVKKAAVVYTRLYDAGSVPAIQAAALVGLAGTDPAAARKRVPVALAGQNPQLQQAAITAALALEGKKASVWLTALLPQLGPAAKALVLRNLDAQAEKTVLAFAEDPDEGIRTAALESLGRIGGSASVPRLLRASADSASTPSKTAAAALASLPGNDANAALAKQAGTGEVPIRIAAISALAARNDHSALTLLLACAQEPNSAVSSAACNALAKLGTDREIDALARLALTTKSPGADVALQTVLARAEDKTAATKKLLALIHTASQEQTPMLFDCLAVVGGAQALDALSGFTGNSDATVKNAAVRALANWPDFAAAKPLLSIATNPATSQVQAILALQGAIRLVKSSDKEPLADRLGIALAALQAAQRAEEKRLAFSALASVPHAQAADALKPYLSQADLRSEAGQAAITLAEALLKKDKSAAHSLAKSLKEANISADITRRADAVLTK